MPLPALVNYNAIGNIKIPPIFEEMYRLMHGSEFRFEVEQLLMMVVGPSLHSITGHVGSNILQPLVQVETDV